LAYNLGNFLRRLAPPTCVRQWSLTTLKEKLVKIGAKVTWHAKFVTFQLPKSQCPDNSSLPSSNGSADLGSRPLCVRPVNHAPSGGMEEGAIGVCGGRVLHR
jgi:hypothetical protein